MQPHLPRTPRAGRCYERLPDQGPIREDIVRRHGTDLMFDAIVHQAQGMVSVQAGCTLHEALVLMQCEADATDIPLERLAARVLDRMVRFNPS